MEKGLLTTNYGTVADWDTVKFIYIEAFPIDERQTWCIVLFLMTGVGLVIVFKKLKHKLHVTKLTMALIEMTFKDHSTIPSSLQDELKDLFKSKE